jgi:hypothetical protein
MKNVTFSRKISKITIIYAGYRLHTMNCIGCADDMLKNHDNMDKIQEYGRAGKNENRNMKRSGEMIIIRYFTFISKYAKHREYRGEIMYRRKVSWNPTRPLPDSLRS